MNIKSNKANYRTSQAENIKKKEEQKLDFQGYRQNKRSTLLKDYSTQHASIKKQKLTINPSQSFESKGKKQNKVLLKTDVNEQDDKTQGNTNRNIKNGYKQRQFKKNQQNENSEEDGSQRTIQSNKRQKSILISINKQKPGKQKETITRNQQKLQMNKEKNKTPNKYLFFTQNQEDKINYQEKLKLKRAHQPSSKQIKNKDSQNSNNQFMNHQQQLPQYIYKKHVHQKGEDKMLRLKNKLGFIFDKANNDEDASVSYYSQSNSQRSNHSSKKVESASKKPPTNRMTPTNKDSKIKQKSIIQPKTEKKSTKASTKPKQSKKQQQKQQPQKKDIKQSTKKNAHEQNESNIENKKPIIIFKKLNEKQKNQHQKTKTSIEQQPKIQTFYKQSSDKKFSIKLEKVQTKPNTIIENKSKTNRFSPIYPSKTINYQNYNQIEYKFSPRYFDRLKTEPIESPQQALPKENDYLDEQLMQIMKKNDEYIGIQKNRIYHQNKVESDEYERKNDENFAVNRFSHHIPRRRFKTQMNQREDQSKGLTERQRSFLKLLKKREDELLKKIREEAINNPRYFFGDSYSFKPNNVSSNENRKDLSAFQSEHINNKQIKLNPSTNNYEISKMLPVVSTTTARSNFEKNSQLFNSPPSITHQRQRYQPFNSRAQQQTNGFAESQFKIRMKRKQANTPDYQWKSGDGSDREYKTQNIRQKYEKLKRLLQKI